MIRAVLDANVLASAFIRPQGPPGYVPVFKAGKITVYGESKTALTVEQQNRIQKALKSLNDRYTSQYGLDKETYRPGSLKSFDVPKDTVDLVVFPSLEKFQDWCGVKAAGGLTAHVGLHENVVGVPRRRCSRTSRAPAEGGCGRRIDDAGVPASPNPEPEHQRLVVPVRSGRPDLEPVGRAPELQRAPGERIRGNVEAVEGLGEAALALLGPGQGAERSAGGAGARNGFEPPRRKFRRNRRAPADMMPVRSTTRSGSGMSMRRKR